MTTPIVNGPDVDVDPGTLRDLCARWSQAMATDVEVSNGVSADEVVALVERALENTGGVVLHPGALDHSPELLAFLDGVDQPVVHVAMSNPTRIRPTPVSRRCTVSIDGRGIAGYRWAIQCLQAYLAWPYESIVYGEGPDQLGELRVPDGAGPHPVVVLLHGGSYREQWRRDLMTGPAVDLARRGVASWNLEFRRVGVSGGGWPTTFDDVARGIDHLERLAGVAPVDPARTAVIGHSSGGHLALWAGARDRIAGGQVGAEPRVVPRLAVSLAGMLDLHLSAWRAVAEGDLAVPDLLGGFPDEVADVYALASPATHAPLSPEVLLVQGMKDANLDLIEMNRVFTATHHVELVELEAADHFSVISPEDDAWRTVAARTVAALTGGGSPSLDT